MLSYKQDFANKLQGNNQKSSTWTNHDENLSNPKYCKGSRISLCVSDGTITLTCLKLYKLCLTQSMAKVVLYLYVSL